MISRYNTRVVFLNTQEEYQRVFKERNTKFISQFKTGNLVYPTVQEISNLNIVNHMWSDGDRFWKLAAKYYKKPHLWWIIAWFNQMPTEGQVKRGDLLAIPLPLEKILDYLEI